MEEMTIHLLTFLKEIGEIKEFTAHKNNKYFGDHIEIEGVTEDGTTFQLQFSMNKKVKDECHDS